MSFLALSRDEWRHRHSWAAYRWVAPRIALPLNAWRLRHSWSAYRWVARRGSRYKPTAILFVFAVPVVLTIGFELFWPSARGWLDAESRHREVGVSLLEHLAVAALVAAAAYYWLFGY